MSCTAAVLGCWYKLCGLMCTKVFVGPKHSLVVCHSKQIVWTIYALVDRSCVYLIVTVSHHVIESISAIFFFLHTANSSKQQNWKRSNILIEKCRLRVGPFFYFGFRALLLTPPTLVRPMVFSCQTSRPQDCQHLHLFTFLNIPDRTRKNIRLSIL